MSRHARQLFITAGFAAFVHAAAANAQITRETAGPGAASVPTPAASASDQTETIVTAEKRTERLQDVPISVTVLGAAQLQALRVNSETEIARQTPNLRVSNLGNEDQPKFSLRGISTPDFNFNTTSPTEIFYDEVYVASQFLGGPQIFDLERVEVLRGSQGTLFGKNSTAGAINFITQKPNFDTTGNILVEGGSGAYFHSTGAINAQLIDEKVALRVATRR